MTRAVLELPEIQGADLLAGRFRIVRKLGEGGMGSVYLADDAELGEVALKMARMDLRGDPRIQTRFRNEIRFARGVSHPNICPLFDLFDVDHPRCGRLKIFTMKYLGGETLSRRLSRGPIAIPDAFAIAHGIAAGVDALHAAGMIHRVLKPGNIILTETREGSRIPVIIDFGMAKFDAAPESADNPALGSPGYMAPEQFGSAPLTKAADLYAFGLILREMIPHEWNSALALDPAERPHSAQAFLMEIFEGVSGHFPSLSACKTLE